MRRNAVETARNDAVASVIANAAQNRTEFPARKVTLVPKEPLLRVPSHAMKLTWSHLKILRRRIAFIPRGILKFVS